MELSFEAGLARRAQISGRGPAASLRKSPNSHWRRSTSSGDNNCCSGCPKGREGFIRSQLGRKIRLGRARRGIVRLGHFHTHMREWRYLQPQFPEERPREDLRPRRDILLTASQDVVNMRGKGTTCPIFLAIRKIQTARRIVILRRPE